MLHEKHKNNQQNAAKQNYPGSVASYDTRPGNEVGLSFNTPDPTRGKPVTTTLGLFNSMHGLHGAHGFTGYVTITSLCTINSSVYRC